MRNARQHIRRSTTAAAMPQRSFAPAQALSAIRSSAHLYCENALTRHPVWRAASLPSLSVWPLGATAGHARIASPAYGAALRSSLVMRALRATAERAQTGCHPEKTAFSGMLLIGISSFQSENAPAVFRPCKRAGRRVSSGPRCGRGVGQGSQNRQRGRCARPVKNFRQMHGRARRRPMISMAAACSAGPNRVSGRC